MYGESADKESRASSHSTQLVEEMEAMSLSDDETPTILLFDPPYGSPVLDDPIPRFLFRVVCPRSEGHTDESWVHSKAATSDEPLSEKDIFDWDRTTAARTLNKHLRGWDKGNQIDNFVSWTSSLLFALQYIYYRHWDPKGRSALDEIKLFVVDTAWFPDGTFVRDLDLIQEYYQWDTHRNPKNLKGLRSTRLGGQYFGEYLSQGSLMIEGECQAISADMLFAQNRLQRIQPEIRHHTLAPRDLQRPPWPSEVVRIRKDIWVNENPERMSQERADDCLSAVREILDLFDIEWRLPMAIYFTALIGPGLDIEVPGEPTVRSLIFAHLKSEYLSGSSHL
jgi:hypothetical protein